ncbi:MAG: recombinase family protein, partial [Anaerolineae bacterium]|nr:recombinase family protein [Anaerolineae bacterium]
SISYLSKLLKFYFLSFFLDSYSGCTKVTLELARQGFYDVLLIRDVTRFARDRFKANFVEFELSQCNVKLEFVWQQFSDDDNGEFLKGILYLLAQKEKTDIVKRMNTGKRDKVKKNSFMVSVNAPLGLKAVKDNSGIYQAEIVEEEAKIVQLIFQLYIEDDLSVHAVTEKLNSDRVPTYSQLRGIRRFADTKTRWYPSNVSNILKNETYAGTFTYGRKGTKTYHDKNGKKIVKRIKNPESNFIKVSVPPIVSPDLFLKAQNKLKESHKHKGRKTGREYLMARRIKCHCGYKMTASTHDNGTGKKYLYYRCTGEKAITKRRCKQAAKAELVDTLAWDWLQGLLNGDTLGEKLQNYIEEKEKEIKRLTDKLCPLEHYLEELGKRYNKLIRSYLVSDDFGQSKLEVFKKELEEEMKEYQTRCNKVREELETCKASLEFYRYYVQRKTEGVFFDIAVSADNLPKNQRRAAREFDYDLADSLIEGGEREYTFAEKEKLVKRFNLQAEIVLENDEDKLRLTCDLGEAVLEMYNSKGRTICQTDAKRGCVEIYRPRHQSLRTRGSMNRPASRIATRISLLRARPKAWPARKAGNWRRPAAFICS